MLTTFKVGAEIDLATGDELKDGFNRVLGALPATDPRPIYLSRSTAIVSDGGIATVDLGSPPVGSLWQLRLITLFGNDDHTPLTGTTVGLYCGDPFNLSLAQLKLTGLTVPSATFIPDTCVWCHPNENVVIQTGQVLTVGTQIGAVITIEEWLERDVSRLSGAG